MATIILKVKRIEAEFALTEYGTEVMSTSSVLFTANGSPVDPETMASILSQTFDEFGLPINLQDLRHALEAFAHKFSPEGSNSSSIYAELANHNPGTSYRYGRDQDCFAGIPADISMANSSACNNWNSFILDSPSLMTNGNKPKILESTLLIPNSEFRILNIIYLTIYKVYITLNTMPFRLYPNSCILCS